MRIELPKIVSFIISELEGRGFRAYAVGGCVRDALLGISPHDWDICTSALPDETVAAFASKKLVLSGLKHGTVGIVLGGELYEVTTFRVDGGYTDHRRPDSVRFVPEIGGDLARRDFTVNAMAYSETEGLIDLYGGQRDLALKLVRCVGKPEDRFSEDALRILRALRFAGRFGFELERETAVCALELCDLLDGISQERKTSELKGILSSQAAADMCARFPRIICKTVPGLSAQAAAKGAKLIALLPPVFELRLAALAEEPAGPEGMKLSKKETELCLTVMKQRRAPLPETRAEARRMVRDLGAYARPVLEFMGAGRDASAALSLLEAVINDGDCCTLARLDIKGSELMQLGCKGRQVGEELSRLLEDVIEGRVENEKSALVKRALGASTDASLG